MKPRAPDAVKNAQVAPLDAALQAKPVAVPQTTVATPSQAKGSLLDFMQASPLAELTGSDEPAFERERSRTRRVPRL